METKILKKTIMCIAEEMYNNMEYAKRTNGDKYIKCIKDIEWQKDIIHKAHGDRLPDDDIYERIYNILGVFMECESGEDAQDKIYEIEPDVYTSDLTKWLHDHNENVYYLTEAMEESGGDIKDGFQLLTIAQGKYIQEISSALIAGIQEYIESEE